jgi:hypothetical protein
MSLPVAHRRHCASQPGIVGKMNWKGQLPLKSLKSFTGGSLQLPANSIPGDRSISIQFDRVIEKTANKLAETRICVSLISITEGALIIRR